MKLSEQKRLSILRAAERLFCRHGVEKTSMDQVADQARVSKRTVYNHFDTKETLFHTILQQMQQPLAEEQEVVFDPQQDIEVQLRSIAEQEARLLSSEQVLSLARVAFMHMLQRPELAQQFNSGKLGCMVYLDRFLQQAVAAGVLDIEDIDLAARQFVALLKSFIFYPQLYGLEAPDMARQQYVIQQSVDMFLARYRAR
ncbi:TetR family transcriptional regulator [Natronospirillum operosum]|uniref:TetR family transcriptional regulator n=1 Tax=Natronospirillum operosum TaxID=2759953 RepID=A0A4Z0WAY3_9GAMM|nr:TetR/AcrR family transcriptional regulator [Natronospirillum operosum]TGG91706.1 TetR family transcriptional regulator [Natronospirillum operosum]